MTSSSRRRARLQLTASVVALTLAALNAPVAAQQTGGNGGGPGGTGGATNPLNGTATAGGDSQNNGGGGGGAGVTGGKGGNNTSNGTLTPGGDGGAAAGESGQDGADSTGTGSGGGGGGGAHGATAFPLNGPVVGGNGGNGGRGIYGGGGGGGGYGMAVVTPAFSGASDQAVTGGNGGNGGGGTFMGGNGGSGGIGLFFSGAGSLDSSGAIKGGNGGHGGTYGDGGAGGAGVYFSGMGMLLSSAIINGGNGGTGGNLGNGGIGGVGGAGVIFSASGSLINQSDIQGGRGGAFFINGTVGAGGAGVVGAGLTIDNRDGTIAGGMSGDSVTRANAITFTGGANTLTLAGTGGLTGNIGTASGSTVTFNQSTDVTLGNIITGAGSIIQDGAGKLILTGSNTYSGGTTITSGTLQIGNGGTTGAITGDVTNDGTLAFNRSDTLTVGGLISGSGAVTQAGTGTIRLTGINSYSGLTTISAGALFIDNGSALGSTAAGTIVAFGAALQIQGGFDVVGEALTLNGTGVANDGALRSLSGANRWIAAITLGSSSKITADLGASLVLSGVTGTNTNVTFGGAGAVTVSGVIATGAGGLIKDGSGVTTLTNANTYTGATTISAGALNIRNALALGTTAGGTTVASGAALQIEMPGNDRIGEALTLNGTGVANNGALRAIRAGDVQLNTVVTFGSSSLITADFSTFLTLASGITGTDVNASFGGAGNITVNDVIATGNGSLTKDGAGQLQLYGTNTYTGVTTINDGRLTVFNGRAIADAGAVVVNASGIFEVAESETIGSLAGAGSVVISDAKTLSVGGSNSTTFSGVISDFAFMGGRGNMAKSGTGTLTLTGANTYTGTTTISAGVLNIQHASALGTAAGGTTVASGAALQMQGSFTVNGEALTLNGTGVANDGALRAMSGSVEWSGLITLGSSSLIAAESSASLTVQGVTGTDKDVTFGAAGSISVRGGITTGAGGVTKSGLGTLYLYGTSTYTGVTTIDGGVLRTSTGNNLSSASAVVVNASGMLSILESDTIGSLAGAGSVRIAGGGAALTTGGDNTSTTFSGVISEFPYPGARLVKTGTGTLTLTGDSTYTGTTTINGGELRVNGSLTSAVTVQTGGTLSGTGTISKAVTVESGGTLSAGQSPGTLTVNSLTLDAGSTTVFELGTAGVVGGSGNDLVNVTNNLTLGGVLNVNAPSAGYYRLFNYGTLTSGAVFSAVTGMTQGAARVLTNIDGQVNLLISMNGQTVQFWDGVDMTGDGIVSGGSGTWNGANTNWTGAPGEAAINDAWETSVGVFAGAAGGTVTVEGMQGFDTLQFSTDGYVLQAGTNGQLALVSSSGAGTVRVDGGVTATIATPIVDGNATKLNKVGIGTLVLSGPNTYNGTTTISAGALNIQHASALGTTAGGTIVEAGAALQMQGGITVHGEALALNGTGINNDGALRSISGANGYTGNITLGSSSLITADSGASLAMSGVTGTNTNVTYGGAGELRADGAIAIGTGSLTKEGTGTLSLSGTNTYTGITTINGGTLLTANHAAIVDTGAVVVNASGRLSVWDSETIGSLEGSGAVAIWIGQTLTIGGANTSTTFSGEISQFAGRGHLAKTGTGTLTLTGTNTYAGETTVDGGTLSISGNGSIAASSMTTVHAGGTLAGTGIVGNTTINGGTLAPGNSIGTLTVQGNLVMTAASTYMVEVSPVSADRVDVTGTATLGGATVNASFAAGSYVTKQYTIVNAAGGVTGTFGTQVNTNLPTSFKSSLSYDANNAYLDLTLDFTPTPPPGPTPPTYPSLNANQAAVGNALTGFFNRTGGIPLVFGALDAKGLSQVAGELGIGTQQTSFDAMTIFMGVMMDPFAVGRGEVAVGINSFADEAMGTAGRRAPTDAFASMHRKAPPMAPAFQERWNMWAAGFGGSQMTDGNVVAGSNNTKSSIYGMAAGADYWFSPFTVAGIAMAGGGTNFSVNGGGTGRSDLFQVGGFIRHTIGATYISAAAAYGWQDITTDRTVTVAGLDQLRAKFNANSYSGRVEAGNRFVLPWIGGLGLTPYGAVQVIAFDLPSYAESVVAGSNTFALAYGGKTVTATRSELGLRSDKSFALNDAILTLRGRAAWAHDVNTDRSATATFQTLPGASFVVNGAGLARNAALTSASAELKWMNGWSVAATFEGEFSDVTRSYAGRGVVRYAW